MTWPVKCIHQQLFMYNCPFLSPYPSIFFHTYSFPNHLNISLFLPFLPLTSHNMPWSILKCPSPASSNVPRFWDSPGGHGQGVLLLSLQLGFSFSCVPLCSSMEVGFWWAGGSCGGPGTAYAWASPAAVASQCSLIFYPIIYQFVA